MKRRAKLNILLHLQSGIFTTVFAFKKAHAIKEMVWAFLSYQSIKIEFSQTYLSPRKINEMPKLPIR